VTKPDYVIEPSSPRGKKLGFVKTKFRGCLSEEGDTIWISAIESIFKGRGDFSKLVKRIHSLGYRIKVPSPFPRMEAICVHLGFLNTTELFPEMGERITVMVLEAKSDRTR
jgi:hypothetical protein